MLNTGAIRKIEELMTDALEQMIPSKQLSNKPEMLDKQ